MLKDFKTNFFYDLNKNFYSGMLEKYFLGKYLPQAAHKFFSTTLEKH